jgi:excisionase family DNA binding protein
MKTTTDNSASSARPERHFTPTQVGQLLNFHPESIRRAIREGRIPCVYFGRAIRVAESVVQRILAEGLAGGLTSRKGAE